VLLQIPSVLGAEQVAEFRRALHTADWVDGRVTSGHRSVEVKRNRQLADRDPLARRLGQEIVASLERNPLFVSAALPLKVFPPRFNRYEGGEHFGNHVDNAVLEVPGTRYRLRSDLSATLFLSDPETYEGGELAVEDTYGVHRVKLAAGDMVLYPASSLHHVRPVTSGTRLAAFFWVESMVRDDGERTLLFDLDRAIQQVATRTPADPAVMQLTNVYHNLVRRWANS
jgi:PKHD-type hydroxylase